MSREQADPQTLEAVILDALSGVETGMGVEQVALAVKRSAWLKQRDATKWDEGANHVVFWNKSARLVFPGGDNPYRVGDVSYPTEPARSSTECPPAKASRRLEVQYISGDHIKVIPFDSDAQARSVGRAIADLLALGNQ